MTLKRSFPPVVDDRTRLLILGSLPGERSLAEQRYYAHPQNQFWRLAGAVIAHEGLTELGYEARLKALLAAGVGLWDVVGSARREGSLDGAIRSVSANPLARLVASLPHLRAVAFNGGTSARIGMRALPGSEFALVPLPSSSPAYTIPFTAKRERWLALRRFLDSDEPPE